MTLACFALFLFQNPRKALGDLSTHCSSTMATGLGAASHILPTPLSFPSQEGPEQTPAKHIEAFAYDEAEFVLQGIRVCGLSSYTLSRFDTILQSRWQDRLHQGLFRYHLGELQTRILPGNVGFVAQLNIQRGLERRRPQDIQSVQQKFDPEQFTFNNIRQEEVLFCMGRACTPSMSYPGGIPRLLGPACVFIVINVSPLEYGHVLLIPDPTLSLPQILTPEALRSGLDAVLLSAHPGFRVGFNSLGAFASVNHLHLHGFYLNWELLVESVTCKPLLPEANLYLLQGVPAPGFVFYIEGCPLEDVVHKICRVTNYLIRKEIAHNLFITRGARPEEPTCSEARPGIRIILWARRPCFGIKQNSAFNVALCELAGHLPIKTAQDFEDLTEASAIHTIQEHLLPEHQFAQLQCEVMALLKK